MKARRTTVVVGAGIVGVCVALWVQRQGHHVLLLDRAEPGTGTSYGNACTIADYGCIPVNSPDLLRRLPSLMLSRDSPLRLDLMHVLRYPHWMFGFLRHCTPSRVNWIIQCLGTLLSHTAEGLDPLVEDAGAAHLFRHEGFLYVYSTQRLYEDSVESNRKRAEQGATFDILDHRQTKEIEPALTMEVYRTLWFRETRHVINPQALTDRFMAYFREQGGVFRRANVVAVEPGCQVILDDGKRIPSDATVLCAGAYSGAIRGAGTKQLPLNVERGYHIQFEGRSSLIRRPVGWAESGFYAIPTQEGLRFAGTVELASKERELYRKVTFSVDTN